MLDSLTPPSTEDNIIHCVHICGALHNVPFCVEGLIPVFSSRKDTTLGCDGITFSMLQNSTHTLLSLLDIFNSLLINNEFLPVEWKTQIVCTISKQN